MWGMKGITSSEVKIPKSAAIRNSCVRAEKVGFSKTPYFLFFRLTSSIFRSESDWVNGLLVATSPFLLPQSEYSTITFPRPDIISIYGSGKYPSHCSICSSILRVNVPEVFSESMSPSRGYQALSRTWLPRVFNQSFALRARSFEPLGSPPTGVIKYTVWW